MLPLIALLPGCRPALLGSGAVFLKAGVWNAS